MMKKIKKREVKGTSTLTAKRTADSELACNGLHLHNVTLPQSLPQAIVKDIKCLYVGQAKWRERDSLFRPKTLMED